MKPNETPSEEVIRDITRIIELSRNSDFTTSDNTELEQLSKKYATDPHKLALELGHIAYSSSRMDASEDPISDSYAFELYSELSIEEIKELAEDTNIFLDRF